MEIKEEHQWSNGGRNNGRKEGESIEKGGGRRRGNRRKQGE